MTDVSNINHEAISNIASIYNNGELTVTNLRVTGSIEAPSCRIPTIHTSTLNTTDIQTDTIRVKGEGIYFGPSGGRRIHADGDSDRIIVRDATWKVGDNKELQANTTRINKVIVGDDGIHFPRGSSAERKIVPGDANHIDIHADTAVKYHIFRLKDWAFYQQDERGRGGREGNLMVVRGNTKHEFINDNDHNTY